jgi:hypothetical protein
MEFFPEPFPKPYIIKPDTNHHYHKYHTGAKVIHGYSSFLMLILQSRIIHRTRSSMSFFGIQIQVAQQNADAEIYYCNFTATRMEGIENIENIDISTTIYGTT